jgi:hypothetical protein
LIDPAVRLHSKLVYLSSIWFFAFAVADDFCRHTARDGVRRDIFGDDCARRDDRAFADGDTASATGTGRARLIAPLTLASGGGDLDFGKMIKNFSTGSHTVTLTPSSSATGSEPIVSSDNTQLMLMGGHGDADFTLTGEAGETVQLSAGGSFVLSKIGAASPSAQQQMTVDDLTFLVNVDAGEVVLNDGDTFVIAAGGTGGDGPDFGGTLTVNGDTETGSYEGSFTVTASYQ